MFIILLGTALLLGVVYLANLQEAGRFQQANWVNISLFGITGLGGILTLLVLLTVLMPLFSDQATSDELANVDMQIAFIFLLLSAILSLISVAVISSERIRGFIQVHIVRSNSETRRYNANSVVHTTAIVLAVFLLINTLGNFVAAGGIEGLAEDFSENGFSAVDMLTNLLLYIAASFLGVGIFIRRNFSAAMQRLGINLPNKDTWRQWFINGLRNLAMGAIVGFGLFWVQAGLNIGWQLLAPETIAEQTAAAQELFAAVSGSLFLGFLLAFTAGIGEELFFRGALQTIFGNVLVSIFFVSLHAQYILTPAALIILFVSLIFGLLRNHYTTTAAMSAHFVYNFTPFVIVHFLTQMGISIDSLFIP
jgi:CAAX protease family protein